MAALVKRGGAPRREAGFTMVELLIAAAILAVGILGLTMLQTFALSSGGGSANQMVAIQVAEQVLDQVENVGRNSVFCTHNNFTVPAPAPNYWGGPITQTFTNAGTAGAPAFYTAVITPITAAGAANPGVVNPIQGIGGVAQVKVVVSWSEQLKATGALSTRSVTLYRRIGYATS